MRPDIKQLLNALTLQKSDYVPVMELGIHPKIKEQFIGRPLQSINDEIDFWRRAGYDYVKLQPRADFNPDKIGVVAADTVKLDGTLHYNWASEQKGVITTFEELEAYRFPQPQDFDYSNIEQARALLPEGMGIIAQYGDIFTMTWEMLGFETFSLALFENPELIRALNNRLGKLVLSMFEYFVQSDAVDAIWYSDDIAFSNGLLTTPDALRRYIFPWLKQIGELARAYDKPFIYHTDGVLWNVMDDIIDCGVNALHPIEPKAMALEEVKKRYGDKLCLIGHVDVDLLARGTPQQVKEQVYRNVEIAGKGGGYIIGSGNSIPDYVRLENYVAMLEAAREISNP